MTRRPVSEEYRRQKNERILEKALELFCTEGLSKVKMDDVSRAMGMSKRTLYEMFSNKEELILECFRFSMEIRYAELKQRISDDSNVMDILTEFLRMRIEHMHNVNPCILDEIEQFPRIKEFFRQIQKNHSDHFISFLTRGQNEGFFMKNLNLDIIRDYNHFVSETVRAYKIHHKYSPNDILKCIIIMNLRGLCTPAGIARIDQILETLD